MLVTIDPGADTGWALWQVTTLLACGLGDPRLCPLHRARPEEGGIDTVLIERPVVYSRSPVPPNDVARLAERAGRWAGRYDALGADVLFVTPQEWKGQVPKAIHHARLWAKLTAPERSVVDAALVGVAPSKRHNALDAVGLGLWWGKR